MGDLVVIRNAAGQSAGVPALVARAGKGAKTRFLEFFTVNIRNKNTRAARHFLHWCEGQGLAALRQVQPVHVAAYIEQLGRSMSPTSIKQHLACIRMFV
jgi:site-specific recombinase XerD